MNSEGQPLGTREREGGGEEEAVLTLTQGRLRPTQTNGKDGGRRKMEHLQQALPCL